MTNLDELLSFTELLHKFQQVKRAVLIKGEDRQENDLEHSGQLALIAWYVVSSNNLELNLERVLKYALIHDLVEVYAGDVPFHEDRDGKEERERLAMDRLAEEFTEFEDLHEYIEKYEERADKESKFVYALDKLVPVLNIYLDGGRSWRADGVTLDIITEYKQDKVKISPEVERYFLDLLPILKEKEDILFPKI